MKKIVAFLLMFFVSNICLAKDLVIFGADWCPSCVKLKNYIKANKSKINFIVQELDFDREKDLAKKLGVNRLPTSFIFDDDGNVQSKKIGYDSSYYEWLKNNE